MWSAGACLPFSWPAYPGSCEFLAQLRGASCWSQLLLGTSWRAPAAALAVRSYSMYNVLSKLKSITPKLLSSPSSSSTSSSKTVTACCSLWSTSAVGDWPLFNVSPSALATWPLVSTRGDRIAGGATEAHVPCPLRWTSWVNYTTECFLFSPLSDWLWLTGGFLAWSQVEWRSPDCSWRMAGILCCHTKWRSFFGQWTNCAQFILGKHTHTRDDKNRCD